MGRTCLSGFLRLWQKYLYLGLLPAAPRLYLTTNWARQTPSSREKHCSGPFSTSVPDGGPGQESEQPGSRMCQLPDAIHNSAACNKGLDRSESGQSARLNTHCSECSLVAGMVHMVSYKYCKYNHVHPNFRLECLCCT